MHPNEEPFLVGLVAHWDFRSRSNGNCFPPSHQCRLYRITHDWYGHHFRAVIGIRRHFGSMIGVCRWDAGLFLIARWIGRQNIVLLLASTEPPTQMCDFSTYTISYDAYGGSDSSVGNKKKLHYYCKGKRKVTSFMDDAWFWENNLISQGIDLHRSFKCWEVTSHETSLAKISEVSCRAIPGPRWMNGHISHWQ